MAHVKEVTTCVLGQFCGFMSHIKTDFFFFKLNMALENYRALVILAFEWQWVNES